MKQFGENRAVDGIDLTVPAASFYGIVGPNGAGKTTTLSIVAGLLRADEGSVLICGIDQAAEPLAAKRVMGVLPDRLRTFDRLTGRQLLYYYGLLRGLSADVIEKRTGDLARAFDLGDALNRVVSDYSAGMTKKIMLAGAMIHSPRVLVLDEPFESVDPVSSAVILDILRAYVSHGGTVILSSHGMDLVERVCSRVAIIVNGEVLAEGTIDEVRAGQTLESRFVELAGSSGEVEGLGGCTRSPTEVRASPGRPARGTPGAHPALLRRGRRGHRGGLRGGLQPRRRAGAGLPGRDGARWRCPSARLPRGAAARGSRRSARSAALRGVRRRRAEDARVLALASLVSVPSLALLAVYISVTVVAIRAGAPWVPAVLLAVIGLLSTILLSRVGMALNALLLPERRSRSSPRCSPWP